ncbi:MAG TPA: hypothetical protein PKD51_07125 [Saprospiraceae bacterium]|nr:hypothetical protein [Saprospiraceae bacterium]HMU05869.1 hypothetical protein [Saprospiraceae bacterium]
MEVKTKKIFDQKVSYDPALEKIQETVKTPIKEQKFNDMLNRIGEKKLKTLVDE